MIIALVGLPGSGKSYFAKWFAERNPSFIVLDKDVVRSTLFPGMMTDYSAEQDDFCIDVILRSAKYILSHNKAHHVIIDGRTFTKKYQIEQVLNASAGMNVPCCFVEFVCNDEIIKQRIEEQRTEHYAKNRDYSLYLDLKQHAEPLDVQHLTLYSDGTQTLEDRAAKFLDYIHTIEGKLNIHE
jgi:adenylylsulfate kinase